eukprot:g15741.t1
MVVAAALERDRSKRADIHQGYSRAGALMIERAREQQCTDPEAFCASVNELVQRARSRGLRLGQIQAGELLSTMFRLCVKHEVKLEPKFARILIAIAVLEGVGRSLDPDCNILAASLPVVLKATTMTPMAET